MAVSGVMKLYWACCSPPSVFCDFRVVSVIAELASLRLSVAVVRRCVVCVGANARRTGEDWYCDWLNTESLLCKNHEKVKIGKSKSNDKIVKYWSGLKCEDKIQPYLSFLVMLKNSYFSRMTRNKVKKMIIKYSCQACKATRSKEVEK